MTMSVPLWAEIITRRYSFGDRLIQIFSQEKVGRLHGTVPLFIVARQSTTLYKITNMSSCPIYSDYTTLKSIIVFSCIDMLSKLLGISPSSSLTYCYMSGPYSWSFLAQPLWVHHSTKGFQMKVSFITTLKILKQT